MSAGCFAPAACDQDYDEDNMSSYGIQWWLSNAFLSGEINVGFACLAPANVQQIAGFLLTDLNVGFQNRFVGIKPPLVALPVAPGGVCRTDVTTSMRVDSVRGVDFPPDPSNPPISPLAAAGHYRVDALLSNIGNSDICSLAFQVFTLQSVSGAKPVVLKTIGEIVGTEGVVLVAEDAGGPSGLKAGEQQLYSLIIALGQREPFTFFVGMLGRPANGVCAP